MATHYTATIPFDRIVKIGIWSNQESKLTLSAVYKKLQTKYPGKEIYISNAGFFSMSSGIPAIWGLKADNKEYASEWNKPYMAMKDKLIVLVEGGTKPTAYTDAVSAYPVLIENGKKSSKFSHCLDNSNRGRTMLGYNGKEVIMSCIADTSGNSDFTLDEELNYMLMMGCTHAINLDGGGSSQCNFNGKVISSSRKVSNFVYVVASVDMSTPEKQAQMFLNMTYNSNLVVDGLMGNATKKAIIKGMQKEIGAAVDGSWGNESKGKYKYLGIGSKNNSVNKIKLVQCALCRKGFWDGSIDGVFNDELTKHIKLFQKSRKLSQDGLVGRDTISALLN